MLIPKHMRSEAHGAFAEERDRILEGVLRARISGVSEEILENLYGGEVMVSDNVVGNCNIRPLSLCEAIAIQDFQDSGDRTVWHTIRSKLSAVGDVLIMLSVSGDRSDWQGERDDLAGRRAEVTVASMPYGDTDTATVGLRLTSGGLYIPYLRMDTAKLVHKPHKKALE